MCSLRSAVVSAISLAWLSIPAGAFAQDQPRQLYSTWSYERERERYVASYYFKSNPADQAYKKQVIVHYPDPERNQYIYFYNIEKEKFWGRCVSRHHPKYDGKVMVWNFAKDAPPGKNWGPLTKGDPEIPGSSDGATMNIPPEVPDPPFAD